MGARYALALALGNEVNAGFSVLGLTSFDGSEDCVRPMRHGDIQIPLLIREDGEAAVGLPRTFILL